MSTRKNEAKLGEILGYLRQDPRFKAKLYQKKLESSWQDLMGPWISRETRSIRIKDNVLTLRIGSSALREELDFMKDKIREKVNGLLGEEHVTEVIVK